MEAIFLSSALICIILSASTSLLTWFFTNKSLVKKLAELKEANELEITNLQQIINDNQNKIQQADQEYQKLQIENTRYNETIKHLQLNTQEKSSQIIKLQDRINEAIAYTKHEQIEHTESATKLDYANNQLREKNTEIAHLNEYLDKYKNELLQEKLVVSELRSKVDSSNFIESSKEILGEYFSNIAQQILDNKSKYLKNEHETKLLDVLAPIKQQINQFSVEIKNIYTESIKERSDLSANLKISVDLNRQMTKEAKQLSEALKGNKKLQGSWGETQVEKLLEASGLIKDIEFKREPEFINEEGKKNRPDFIINLPDGKHLVIDSKVSLIDYINYTSAENQQDRNDAHKNHYECIFNHIKSLSEKDYAKLPGIKSPDFVFMFVPIESAFAAALEYNHNLIYDAYQKNITIVSPMSLLASLKTVANLWTIERQNKYARKLTDKASQVYNKLNTFVKKFEDLGTKIQKATDSYEDTLKTLTTGKGNLIALTSDFKKLGVRVKEKLPENVVISADIEENKA